MLPAINPKVKDILVFSPPLSKIYDVEYNFFVFKVVVRFSRPSVSFVYPKKIIDFNIGIPVLFFFHTQVWKNFVRKVISGAYSIKRTQ